MADPLKETLEELEILEKRGRKTLSIKLLKEVLTYRSQNVAPSLSEIERLSYEARLAEWAESNEIQRLTYLTDIETKRQSDLVMFNAVIQFAVGALKTAALINGGAAVACLSYLGAVKETALVDSMLFFTVRLLLAAIAHGMAFLAQNHFAEGRPDEGMRFRTITGILTAGSYFAFLIGTTLGYLKLDPSGYLAQWLSA